MQKDKLFNVTLDGTKTILGVVKAETMQDAMDYCAREYQGYKVVSIDESPRILL